jgi:hypothetical protein
MTGLNKSRWSSKIPGPFARADRSRQPGQRRRTPAVGDGAVVLKRTDYQPHQVQ